MKKSTRFPPTPPVSSLTSRITESPRAQAEPRHEGELDQRLMGPTRSSVLAGAGSIWLPKWFPRPVREVRINSLTFSPVTESNRRPSLTITTASCTHSSSSTDNTGNRTDSTGSAGIPGAPFHEPFHARRRASFHGCNRAQRRGFPGKRCPLTWPGRMLHEAPGHRPGASGSTALAPTPSVALRFASTAGCCPKPVSRSCGCWSVKCMAMARNGLT